MGLSVLCLVQEFLVDYEKFKNTVNDLDLRLSTIVMQAFDDCSGLEGMFKVSSQLSGFGFHMPHLSGS